jgi:hypothetical protein
VAVEAKSGEPLDKPVEEWLKDISPGSGKPARLSALRQVLGLTDMEVGALRYQLLHRAAAAVRMAEDFGASLAVLIVHSFGGRRDDESHADFGRFAEAMMCSTSRSPVISGRATCVPLMMGWLASPTAGEVELANSV